MGNNHQSLNSCLTILTLPLDPCQIGILPVQYCNQRSAKMLTMGEVVFHIFTLEEAHRLQRNHAGSEIPVQEPSMMRVEMPI